MSAVLQKLWAGNSAKSGQLSLGQSWDTLFTVFCYFSEDGRFLLPWSANLLWVCWMLWMDTTFTSTIREIKYLDVSTCIPVALGTVLNFLRFNSWLCLTSVVTSPLVIPCFPILTGASNYEVCMKNLMYIFCD